MFGTSVTADINPRWSIQCGSRPDNGVVVACHAPSLKPSKPSEVRRHTITVVRVDTPGPRAASR